MSPYTIGQYWAVPTDNPKSTIPVFVNTYTGAGMSVYPPGRWNVIHLAGLVPDTALAVQLSTLLIITHGTTPEDANLTVALRRHGSETDNSGDYQGQVIEPAIGGGQRSTWTETVALSTDGLLAFDLFWNLTARPAGANWPQYSAYAINMGIAAVLLSAAPVAKFTRLLRYPTVQSFPMPSGQMGTI
jgi:hypothetical protein